MPHTTPLNIVARHGIATPDRSARPTHPKLIAGSQPSIVAAKPRTKSLLAKRSRAFKITNFSARRLDHDLLVVVVDASSPAAILRLVLRVLARAALAVAELLTLFEEQHHGGGLLAWGGTRCKRGALR